MKKVVLALFIIFLPTISFAEDINWLYKNRTDATIDVVQTKDMSDKVMVKVNNKNIYGNKTKTINSNIKNGMTIRGNSYIKVDTQKATLTPEQIKEREQVIESAKKGDFSRILYSENEMTKTYRASQDNAISMGIYNDPYMIKISNNKYYLVKDSLNNQYTLNNIIGYTDKRGSLFTAMRKLDLNKDNKITSSELKKQNIRFVRLDFTNKLILYDKTKDFNLNNIEFIDLSTLRESVNNGNIGSFGYFDVYVKLNDGIIKKITGCVTFETDKELMELIK